MGLKRELAEFLRNQVAMRFSRVRSYETEKFVEETARVITDEADSRGLGEARRHYLLYKIQRRLLPDFVIADHGRVILKDAVFRNTFERFSSENWTSFERKWNLKELVRLTHSVEGDYAECGVFRGGSAFFMCESARTHGKTVHLFDSFEGLSAPQAHEGFHWSAGDLAISEETVCSNLAGFNNYRTYKGWIPERFQEVEDLSFSFVHIDVDLEQPTRDSIEFFYPRLSQGGVLVLDDHGSAMCPGARATALDYFSNTSEQVLDLATGQGMVIKQNERAR